MLFGSLQFLIFFVVVFAAAWLCANNTWRKVILVAASYAFYAYWDYRFLSLVVFVTLCAWGSTRLVGELPAERQRRGVVIVAVALQLAVLGFFKYFNFFGDSMAALARSLGAHVDGPTLAIILPVGLSFYVFHSISYTVDGFKGRVKPLEFSLVDVALYIAFFPQLIAGPIVRGLDFLPQLRALPVWSSGQAAWAIRLFVLGFCYKYLLADNLGLIADPVFKNPGAWNGLALWAGVASYYAQIYFDFAGYSWMAIGCAGLLGYVLPTNFNFPYTAFSTTEFWRRWHISLSTWLRDYLFIPLGGSRRGRGRYYANVFITMGLGGLWHGASWNFALWGLMHGVGLTVHKWITGERPSRVTQPATRVALGVLALAITQLWVMLLWVFFRAQSFGDSMTILSGMFGLRNGSSLQSIQIAALALPLALVALDGALGRASDARSGSLSISPVVFGAALGLVIVAVLFGTVMANKPFIYFQF
jgi:alginate O-acetyltransferase complex protein AlgI